ncbi:MAG: hypothetical protein J0L92_27780 [Deltaproteobacteria bacterium]|nr:hypothetical protein [Deltaproteobacteria bacterium]
MRSRASLLVVSCVGPLVLGALVTAPVRAQDVTSTDAVPVATESAAPEVTTAVPDATAVASPAPPSDAQIRVAVVLVGDPNDEARASAERVESAVRDVLALPSDTALRASLIGVAVEDAIVPVVRDRRALGGTEREDVPLLSSLGDRADVVLLLVVRARAGARELVAFDVRHRAFFEGSIVLDADLDAARVVRFARSRGRAALGGDVVTTESTAALEARVVESDEARAAAAIRTGAQDAEHEPEWIEVNWPYLVAGALLAGAAAFVIVYTANDSDPVPMLRFRPGGSP